MAHVPLRIAQPGLMAPHQQRPMMVSMTQPPPVSMQGLPSVMGPGGGMTVMTQAMNHPDSAANGPYHPHALHHAHASSRSHGQTQNHLNGHSHTQYQLSNSNSFHSQSNRQNSHHQYSVNTHSNPIGPYSAAPITHLNQSSIDSNGLGGRQNYTENSARQQQSQMKSDNQQIDGECSGSTFNSQNQVTPVIQSRNAQMQSAKSQISDGCSKMDKVVPNSTGAKNVTVLTSVSKPASSSASSNSTKTEQSSKTAENSRDKTPMSLINELARHNKIPHQYCLIDEQGPAHKKIFTVTLKLGEKDDEEQYSASGASIKKAQHEAASLGLEKTKFNRPPPRTSRQGRDSKLTPTVELNAIAMKRGESTSYMCVEPRRQMGAHYGGYPQYNYRNQYNHSRYGRQPVYTMYFVHLRVGSREFTGEGATHQLAKHDAATKALKIIKDLPLPPNIPQNPADTSQSGASPTEENADPESSGEAGQAEMVSNAELKSAVSLVHEIALRRNLTVGFEVLREYGPPHLRVFITQCTVGDVTRQGEGTGKKVSKKAAAQAMYEELRKLPPLPPSLVPARVKPKPVQKKRVRNLVKEQNSTPEESQTVNPITRLIQIQQAKKEKEPVYQVVSEKTRGSSRCREFIIMVNVGTLYAQGSGRNKKQAKRRAAEKMLEVMGYSTPSTPPPKPALKSGKSTDTDRIRKVKFVDNTESTCISVSDPTQPSGVQTQSITAGSGRQLVPGLIMMKEGAGLHGYNQMQHNQNNGNPINLQTTATIAKELLESGSSATAKSINNKNASLSTTQSVGPASVGSDPKKQSKSSFQNPQPLHSHSHHSNLSSLHRNGPQESHRQSQQSDLNPGLVQNNVNENGAHANVASNARHGGGLTISGNTNGQAIRPKEQLMYLANILNLQVQFTDFPKGNKSEFLSLVSLSTSPPHVSHGSGPTIETSHDQACLTALRALAEMGLDSVNPGSS